MSYGNQYATHDYFLRNAEKEYLNQLNNISKSEHVLKPFSWQQVYSKRESNKFSEFIDEYSILHLKP